MTLTLSKGFWPSGHAVQGAVSQSGGTTSSYPDGSYNVVTWASSGSITIADNPLNCDILIVAGGGGGGSVRLGTSGEVNHIPGSGGSGIVVLRYAS